MTLMLLISAHASPTASWQKHGVILNGQAARGLLRLCYRPELQASAQWIPSSDQVTQLEARLKAKFSTFKYLTFKPAGPLGNYYRQYAGFVVAGRKIIFVNFFPTDISTQWRSEAVLMCDGGPSFWSVEYEVDEKKFVNAVASGRI
jgi:hypothetical protein